MTHTAKHTPGPTCTCHILLRTGDELDSSHGDRPCSDISRIELCSMHAAAPAMYEALLETMQVLRSLRDSKEEWYTLVTPELLSVWDKNKKALAQAEGH